MRKQVNYNDEISEGQWLKIIEAGGDPNSELAKMRKRKADGEAEPARNRRKTDGIDGEASDDYGDEDGGNEKSGASNKVDGDSEDFQEGSSDKKKRSKKLQQKKQTKV
jgi:hypothetical protein